MIKKFFKALLIGLRLSEEAKDVIKLFVVIGWLPTLLAVILKIANVKLDEECAFFIYVIAFGAGMFIACYVQHCVDAVKYSDEKQCDMKEAWDATAPKDNFL